jgi:hypothetical protein
MKQMRLTIICWVAVILAGNTCARAQSGQDAAAIYKRAAALLNVDCPSSSNKDFSEEPPYSAEWVQMEKAAFEADQPAFALVHQARSVTVGDYSGETFPRGFHAERALAMHVGDAIIYEHLQGGETAAMEKINDLLHIADTMDNSRDPTFIRALVAAGLRALAAARIMVVASDVRLTDDSANPADLQVNSALQLISKLLDLPKPEDRMKKFNGVAAKDVTRGMETFNRINAECSMAAMSVGCHIFLLEEYRWPNSAAELVPNYLPQIPIDPWGDGKQTLGYVLIKGGLPDGSDRPLVYSRCRSADGLFFRTDRPMYGFYNRPHDTKKDGGQFRDVGRWTLGENVSSLPTTRPLP